MEAIGAAVVDHEVCGDRTHLSLAGDASGTRGACGYASRAVIDSAGREVEGIET